MSKVICFDMDGTLADFYSVPNWLEKLKKEDPAPYIEAAPLWDMEKLREALLELIEVGWEVCVISWLAGGNASERYKEAIRQAKRAWLAKYHFPANRIHLLDYGTAKASCMREAAILVDDDEKVRESWYLGETIDPSCCDLIKELKRILK